MRWFFFSLRKYQGLGLGDVKLLAASGIWIGIAGVPVQLLVASLSALTAAAILRLAGCGVGRKTSLPFGPFLVLGLLTALWIEQSGGLQHGAGRFGIEAPRPALSCWPVAILG